MDTIMTIFDWIIIKLTGNQDRHKISDEFEFWPHLSIYFGITCPWAYFVWSYLPLIAEKKYTDWQKKRYRLSLPMVLTET